MITRKTIQQMWKKILSVLLFSLKYTDDRYTGPGDCADD